VGVRLSLIKSEGNMTKKELIEKLVNESKNFPNPTIEYNFDLEEEGLSNNDFQGVKHLFSPRTQKGQANLTYKL